MVGLSDARMKRITDPMTAERSKRVRRLLAELSDPSYVDVPHSLLKRPRDVQQVVPAVSSETQIQVSLHQVVCCVDHSLLVLYCCFTFLCVSTYFRRYNCNINAQTASSRRAWVDELATDDVRLCICHFCGIWALIEFNHYRFAFARCRL